MLTEQIAAVFEHEGPVAIVTGSPSGPHLVGTWNSYFEIIGDKTLAIPAWGYRQTEENVKGGSTVELLIGTKALPGKAGRPGRGFRLIGEGRFETEGAVFEKMSALFSGIRAVFLVTIKEVEQQL